MKVVLKKASYFSNLVCDYVNGTRFFVQTNGKEEEIKNLVNVFFPKTNLEFKKQLTEKRSEYRNKNSYRAEKDYLMGKPVNLTGECPRYVNRYLNMLDVYYYDDAERDFSDCDEEFVTEIDSQDLRVLLEPWKYSVDRRSCIGNKKGS